MKNERPGIYVHIPFCQCKCYYCDFVSYPAAASDPILSSYLSALVEEMKLRRTWLEDQAALGQRLSFHSVYIGGGTPSLLPISFLARLLAALRRNFAIESTAEITVEVNPGTVSARSLAAYREMGINRLSIGVQSFDDGLLAGLGRLHSAAGARSAVQTAKAVGFTNVSMDLMSGLPGQSLASWHDTLQQALSLCPEHMSCYELTIASGTPYGQWYDAGALVLPSEDEAVAMLCWTADYLGAHGYCHYEISNYALPGFACRHNLLYWQNSPYLGLGAAAHSYWQGRRWGNEAGLEAYRDRLVAGELPEAEVETLSAQGQAGETIMVGLRLRRGVCLAEVEARFGVSVDAHWGRGIEGFLRQGLVEVNAGYLRLTDRGLLLANQVQSLFV